MRCKFFWLDLCPLFPLLKKCHKGKKKASNVSRITGKTLSKVCYPTSLTWCCPYFEKAKLFWKQTAELSPLLCYRFLESTIFPLSLQHPIFRNLIFRVKTTGDTYFFAQIILVSILWLILKQTQNQKSREESLLFNVAFLSLIFSFPMAGLSKTYKNYTQLCFLF